MINRRHLVASGLAATGLTSASRTSAQIAQPNAAEMRLNSAAAKVKAYGAVAWDALPAQGLITSSAQETLAMAGFTARAGAAMLRMFFTSAQISLGHVASATPIVGYYSPPLDIWWLTRWANGSAGPQLTEAKIAPGGAIATGGRTAAPEEPRWMARMRRSTLIEALRETTQGAYAEFRAEFSPLAREAPRFFDRIETRDKDLLRQRAAAFAIRIADFQDDRRVGELYRQTLQRLAAERPEPPTGLAPDARAAFVRIGQISQIIRSGLGPVAAFQLQGRWFLIAAGPSSGRVLVLAAIDPKANEPILRLTLVDTMAQEGAA